ncbi:hypothetical protein POJ06DRAFT_252022 [Lipomyces tetrasporus]|uniref:Uncharacterized protein n=1 Tax=Lipomyces tetrasporus TaxID=54092 RepID=A0AAD7VSC9_9ASCO|nr:uncharacterized protein POJ06DRAFT_252022 [Lipomyces tetrasporus]KAJ8100193.1 hypothetical protein POJ06DRAFT_252022 [Lipomyces tetrasporus]
MQIYPVRLNRRICPATDGITAAYLFAHAVAAISYVRRDAVDFVDPCFRVESLEATYMNSIHAMPTIAVENDTPICRPPTTRRPPGRPHKSRDRSNEFVARRLNICGRCKK